MRIVHYRHNNELELQTFSWYNALIRAKMYLTNRGVGVISRSTVCNICICRLQYQAEYSKWKNFFSYFYLIYLIICIVRVRIYFQVEELEDNCYRIVNFDDAGQIMINIRAVLLSFNRMLGDEIVLQWRLLTAVVLLNTRNPEFLPKIQ